MSDRSRSATRIGRILALVALVATVLLVGGPAGAQPDEAPGTDAELLLVDATDAEMATVVRAPSRPEVSAIVNGVEARGETTVPISADARGTQTVIVLDNSTVTSDDADATDALRGAAADYVASLRSGEEIAVVTTGGRAEIEQNFTTNASALTDLVQNGAAAGGRNAVWESVSRAAKLFDDDRAINDIIVLVGSADEASDVTSTTARGDAITASARVHVIGFGANVNADALAELSSTTGGTAVNVARTDAAREAAKELRALTDGTYVTQFTTTALRDGSSLELIVDDETIDASYIAGSVVTGDLLAPIDTGGESGGLLTGTATLVVGMVLMGLAAGLFIYAVASLAGRDSSLSSVLQPYSEDGVAQAEGGGFANSALFQRAVEMTGNIAEERGVLERVETMLERADMPLRAAEALTFYLGFVVVSAVSGLLLTRSLIPALVIAVLALMLPPAYVNFRAGRRRKAFMSQLPGTLQLLSSTLKAGYSFMQGVEATSHEVEDPMGEELRRVVSEAQLGRPLESALEASADRMGSEDFGWAILAVRIQREVGGNLSELLLTVSETMTARERLRREVSALTAEGKISAIVLGVLPIGLGFAMWAINPDYIGTLFSETVGNFMLGGSVILALLGFAWMKKIVDIEI